VPDDVVVGEQAGNVPPGRGCVKREGGLSEFGYGVITFLQQWRSPALDAFFHTVSFLGEELFYLVLVPVLYWHVDKRMATRFAVLFLVSAFVNTLLKSLVAQPRPSPPRVAVLAAPGGGGVPSGHAQNGLVSWGWLALRTRRRGAAFALAALIPLIGLSRLYLGVHFPHDVLAGYAVGAVLLVTFVRFEPGLSAWLNTLPTVRRSSTGAALAALPLLVYRESFALSALATLVGVAAVVPFERTFVRLDVRPFGVARTAARLALGLAVAIAIWQGLRVPLAPLGTAGTLARYMLLGGWCAAGAPWLFVRLGLAQREAAFASTGRGEAG
jgi:membrane-associated phospholipid phosphatase